MKLVAYGNWRLYLPGHPGTPPSYRGTMRSCHSCRKCKKMRIVAYSDSMLYLPDHPGNHIASCIRRLESLSP